MAPPDPNILLPQHQPGLLGGTAIDAKHTYRCMPTVYTMGEAHRGCLWIPMAFITGVHVHHLCSYRDPTCSLERVALTFKGKFMQVKHTLG